MKKKIGAALVFLAIPIFASAGNPQKAQGGEGGSGCGLGSMLFDGNSGVGAHSFAMTTNGSFGNNTFGMSSGTLGCDANLPVKYRGERVYISGNMTKLAEDIARGEGETLTGLAELMGISAADKPKFFALTQRNFDRLFNNETVSSDDVATSLISLLKADALLSKYVS